MTRTPDTFTARMTRAAATAAPPKKTPVRHAVAPRTNPERAAVLKLAAVDLASGLRKMNSLLADIDRRLAAIESNGTRK